MDVLLSKEFTPLTPDILEYKLYAPGVGVVLSLGVSGGSGREELVRYNAGGPAELHAARTGAERPRHGYWQRGGCRDIRDDRGGCHGAGLRGGAHRPAEHRTGESAAMQGIPVGSLLRTIVVPRAADDYVFVLVPGGRQIDWPKLRSCLGREPPLAARTRRRRGPSPATSGSRRSVPERRGL
ncbi:MAG: hypothetical protein U0V56_07245 [Actinomycetota bacterium]